MKFFQINSYHWIRWCIAWFLGAIVFLIVTTWPDFAHSWQNGPSAESRSSDPVEMTDKQIVAAIVKKAAIDGIALDRVKSFSTKGIVTFDGEVYSLADQNHLRRIASGIRGVRGVVNRLSVSPSSLTDSQIKSAVVDQLKLNSATDAYGITVSVKDGKVMLSGTVDGLAEKQLTSQVVSDVRGVREIDSSIEVNYSEQRSDREIRSSVIEQLVHSIWIDEQLIDVEVADGTVRFRGKVASADLKEELGLLALTTGVTSVDDSKVEVDSSLTIVSKKRNPSANLDFEIRNALIQSLRLDPRIDLRNLELEVDSGIVLLKGTVGDLQSRRAAMDTARNVAGVAKVVGTIEIEDSSPISDELMEERLLKAFDRTATLKFDNINTGVESGTVKLSGTVPSQYQRRRAEAIAFSLAGVRGVENGIEIVNPRDNQTDLEINLNIERAMRWSPYLYINRLKYSVDERIVTFSGTVTNQQSLDLARAIAIDAGARDIIVDDVKIQ
jgi:osmotically-inducible protein OsmY